jgi:hypothetical protein
MRTLVRGGTVVSMDLDVGALPQGDVLIEDGRIAAAAATCDAADAEVVDATGKIVMPGFVDTHRHTWQTAFRGIGADWTFDQYRVAMHGTLRPHYQPEDVHLGNPAGPDRGARLGRHDHARLVSLLRPPGERRRRDPGAARGPQAARCWRGNSGCG